jgi:hypothetical protein
MSVTHHRQNPLECTRIFAYSIVQFHSEEYFRQAIDIYFTDVILLKKMQHKQNPSIQHYSHPKAGSFIIP